MTKWSDAAIRVTEWLVVVILVLCVFVAEASNPDKMYSDGFECRVDCPPPVEPIDPNACIDADGFNLPGIRPAGWVGLQLSWQQAFSAPICLTNPRDPRCRQAAYPNSLGVPVPIGTFKGAYLSIPFTPTSGLTVDMSWDTAQANGSIGYGTPRPADAMWIAISPCAGDMRPPDTTENPWTKEGCRVLAGGATLVYRTFGNPSHYVCRLQPNERYYLTVSPSNPLDGLEFGEHTCSNTAVNSQFRCDVQMRHTGVISPVLNQIGDILGRDWSKK